MIRATTYTFFSILFISLGAMAGNEKAVRNEDAIERLLPGENQIDKKLEHRDEERREYILNKQKKAGFATALGKDIPEPEPKADADVAGMNQDEIWAERARLGTEQKNQHLAYRTLTKELASARRAAAQADPEVTKIKAQIKELQTQISGRINSDLKVKQLGARQKELLLGQHALAQRQKAVLLNLAKRNLTEEQKASMREQQKSQGAYAGGVSIDSGKFVSGE